MYESMSKLALSNPKFDGLPKINYEEKEKFNWNDFYTDVIVKLK